MSKFTKELINEYADKLLIGLTDEECEMVLKEFETIDENLNLVNQITGINNVVPMTHCLDDFTYILREDVAKTSPDIRDLLKNSDVTEGREIVVPKVVGE